MVYGSALIIRLLVRRHVLKRYRDMQMHMETCIGTCGGMLGYYRVCTVKESLMGNRMARKSARKRNGRLVLYAV